MEIADKINQTITISKAYIEKNDLDNAEKILKRLYDSFLDKHDIVTISYFEVLILQNKEEVILDEIDKHGMNDSLFDLYKFIAQKLIARQLFAKAIELLSKLLKLNRDDPLITNLIGQSYYFSGNYDIAESFFKSYLEKGLKEYLHKTFFMLGYISFLKYDYDDAISYFENSRTISNEANKFIEEIFTKIHFDKGNYEDSIKSINCLTEKPNLLFMKSLSLFMLKRSHDAKECFIKHKRLLEEYMHNEFMLNLLQDEYNAERWHGLITSTRQGNEIPKGTIDNFKKYTEELSLVWEMRDKIWQKTIILNDYDGLFLYSVIRNIKSKNVIEFSPFKGYSTTFIYKALEKNGQDFTFATFDIATYPEFTETMQIFNIPIKVIEGDALETVPEYIRSKGLEGKINLCFIDSDHGYQFAESYIKKIFPLLGKDCIIIIHDMYFCPDDYECLVNHYESIKGSNISGNCHAVGEGRALRKHFLEDKDYKLFSTHKLFGGITSDGVPLPINTELISSLPLKSVFLEGKSHWKFAPMMIMAVPKGIMLKNVLGFSD